MTRDEQKSITAFVAAAAAASEPELDVEADAIIRALFVRNPAAAYRITMLAMAQQAQLAACRPIAASPPMAKAPLGWLTSVLKGAERQTPRGGPAERDRDYAGST